MKHTQEKVSTDKTKNIVHLISSFHWFDMVESGKKTTEYREIKDYYTRKISKTYTFTDITKPDFLMIYRGYTKGRKIMKIECTKLTVAQGQVSWGAVMGKWYYAFELGKIIAISNTDK